MKHGLFNQRQEVDSGCKFGLKWWYDPVVPIKSLKVLMNMSTAFLWISNFLNKHFTPFVSDGDTV